MQIQINDNSLPVYEALASPVRLEIIQLLSKEKLSIAEIAQTLHLSSAIISSHIKKLSAANLIKIERVGHQKISSLKVDTIEVCFPEKPQQPLIAKRLRFPLVNIRLTRLNLPVD